MRANESVSWKRAEAGNEFTGDISTSADPRAFAGLDEFKRQTATVAQQCHASRPARAGTPVRTPGEKGLALADGQSEAGVALYPSILPMPEPWARKLGIAMPDPGT